MPTLEEPTSRGKSLGEVHGSVGVTQSNPFRRLFAFMGPAYLVSVGYMDPGNWATDLEGGRPVRLCVALGPPDVER